MRYGRIVWKKKKKRKEGVLLFADGLSNYEPYFALFTVFQAYQREETLIARFQEKELVRIYSVYTIHVNV